MAEVNNKTGYPHFDKPWMKFYDEKELSRGRENLNLNLTSYLKEVNKGYGSYIANTYYGKSVTYDEFWEKVDLASKVLQSWGVKKGDRIMNLVPNIPEAGYIWLGASQIGAVSDFIDPRPDSMDLIANAKKTLELIKFEKADHIIALDKCYLGMLKPIERELREFGIDKIITLSAADSMNLLGSIDYLKDVANYNSLRNQRNKNEKIAQLRNYQAVIKKIQSMRREDKIYNQAVQDSLLNVVKYSDLLKEVKFVKYRTVEDENLLNYIGHTSGTSGSRPKPICLTNKNIISSAEQLAKGDVIFNVGDKVLHELPYFSPLGAGNNFVLNIISQANSIEVPEFEINEFGYLVKKHHPNVILGTPAWLSALLNCKYLNNEDLSCITTIIYGGDSMTKEDEDNLNKWLKSHGSSATVEKGHGMSEYCGCGSYAQKDYNHYESIGIPLPDTIYTIVNPEIDDHLEPIKFKDDEEILRGELAVSSDAVTCGKIDDSVVVPHYTLDGKSYIRTRDLVNMDRDGIFRFESRKDRSFTRFDGFKVKPYEIEKVIEANNKVKYCVIVQYFDEKQRGFMPIAHLVLEDPNISLDECKDITEEIVNKQIINNPDMSSRQIPAKFKFRDSLPLTANSKVNFNSLIKEGIDGSEVSVNVEETNISVGNIQVLLPEKSKKLTLKK